MNEPVRSSIGWYACRTRPRAEKQVGRLLRLRRVESYVPLLEQVRQWTDRKKRVGFPLFPGYVFARFSLAMVHEVLRTPGIVTIVRNHAGPAPVADDELDSVRTLVAGVNAGSPPPEPVEFLEVGQGVEAGTEEHPIVFVVRFILFWRQAQEGRELDNADGPSIELNCRFAHEDADLGPPDAGVSIYGRRRERE